MEKIKTPEVFTIEYYFEKYKFMNYDEFCVEISKDIMDIESDLRNKYHQAAIQKTHHTLKALSWFLLYSDGARPTVDDCEFEQFKLLKNKIIANNKFVTQE